MSGHYHTNLALESKSEVANWTKTTLYELLEAIHDVVEEGEETLIPKIVLNLIDAGKIRIGGNSGYFGRTRTFFW